MKAVRGDQLLKRHAENPIITPSMLPGADATFNCGQTMYNGKTILLVAIDWVKGGRLTGEGGNDEGASTETRVAESDDGVHFTFRDKPLMDFRGTCLERYTRRILDTRVTKIDDTYYIVFPGQGGFGPCGVLARTKDFETAEPMGIIALPPNRVPCLFPEKIRGRYARIDRPGHTPSGPGDMWVSYSPDLLYWGDHRFLTSSYVRWTRTKMGPTPPIKTKEGWLVIIHGVQTPCSGNVYRLGALLLDLEDPTRIIGRTRSWILAPTEPYEILGNVLNVVFACGAIADYDQDRLRVYYGCADTSIGLATCRLSDLVAMCIEEA
ncbi:MAG: glycoside hydrolase family 130 protein [Candidatus Sumerlaeota bacterium]|nr:glycoside hydrolase family 130 protein [Candidatus Sumerlaeota bacterium]